MNKRRPYQHILKNLLHEQAAEIVPLLMPGFQVQQALDVEMPALKSMFGRNRGRYSFVAKIGVTCSHRLRAVLLLIGRLRCTLRFRPTHTLSRAVYGAFQRLISLATKNVIYTFRKKYTRYGAVFPGTFDSYQRSCFAPIAHSARLLPKLQNSHRRQFAMRIYLRLLAHA